MQLISCIPAHSTNIDSFYVLKTDALVDFMLPSQLPSLLSISLILSSQHHTALISHAESHNLDLTYGLERPSSQLSQPASHSPYPSNMRSTMRLTTPSRLLVPGPLLLALLAFAQPAHASDFWDDFTNNLATDLAPIISLFGEQTTKQFLSECITATDYFIFSVAPLGILTAVVSAIRVCGSPALRAFIGRAQESASAAEAELCSSTSRNVCEVYNNGSIARVFGRPKVLEIVTVPNGSGFRIMPFYQYLNTTEGEMEWDAQASAQFFSTREHEVGQQKFLDSRGRLVIDDPGNFAPNLSLNLGTKRVPKPVNWAAAVVAFVGQFGVLVYAAVATYYLRLSRDDQPADTYVFPLTCASTILLCCGI
jgi:hypothetical protein